MPIPDLSAHLRPQLAQVFGRPIDLAPLADKGLAHWHVRLIGTGLLARIPKQSQMNLGAVDNLAYEAACFERTAVCGHVPRLARVIEPSSVLPWGALLVEEINGCPASQPAHIAPIMQALAAIHTLPVPAPEHRPPLLNENNPMQGLLALVRAQAVYLDHPALSVPSRRVITTRLQALARMLPHLADALAPRLISFDAHPGNFLITTNGKAVLVDLEKLRYSYPPLDLAHATLYTSTTWDVAASFELSTPQVAQAYEDWRAATGSMAEPYLAALVPLRELMWLWSVTWCAKWLTESGKTKTAGAQGEDWSQTHSDHALIDHVRSRVNDYLSIGCINRVQQECRELARLYPQAR
ncbi:MAG: phosphotransferase [Rhodoferax sp.]